MAQARLKQAEAEQQASRYAIAGRVAGAYWNAVVLSGISTLLQKDIEAVDGMVQYDKARVDEGAMRGVDLLRMRIERDRLLLAKQSAEREAAQARLELLKQIGRPPAQQVLVLTDTLETRQPVPLRPQAEVLAARPDLQVAREAVELAEADVALQRAVGVPNVDLIGGYKRNNAANTGYGALQMDLPFHNRNQGEVERARAALRYAQSSNQALEFARAQKLLRAKKPTKRSKRLWTKCCPICAATPVKTSGC